MIVNRSRAFSVAALIFSLALYFGIGLAQLKLPGLQYDEAADAVPAMEVLLNKPPSSISTINIAGREWPLMMLHHIGPSTIYTSMAGMSVFGISVEGLRISQLCVGAIALVLVWALARSGFDEITAGLAALLCATAPAFIWWNRAGANWTAPLLPLALGFVLAMRRWVHQPKARWLLFAGLLFGLGFTTKILFVWLLAPLGLTALIALRLRGVGLLIRRASWAGLLLAVLGLLIGLLPFLLHNLRAESFLATFNFILNNASQTRLYGHNNLDLLNNLALVGGEFLRMMGGDTLHFDAPAGLPLGAIALVAAGVYTAWRLIWHWRVTSHPILRLFLLLCFVAVLPLSTVSTSSIGATYLFIIVPFMWLLIATALADGARVLIERRQVVVACAAVALLPLNHIATNVFIQRFFAETGGTGWWSDAIYAVADELQTHHADRTIIAMDWGFARNLDFLTQRRLYIREGFEYAAAPPADYEDLCIAFLREPQNVYLFHAENYTAFTQRWKVFERAALKTRKQLNLIGTLTERTGITNTLLYDAVDAQPSFDRPNLAALRNAGFADAGNVAVTLLGGDVNYDAAAHEVSVMLHWQADRAGVAGSADDVVLVHIVDQSNGEVVTNGDQQPVYGSYPFDKWQAGEVVLDPHWVSLPADLKPGVYQVRVGIYDKPTGARYTITDPQNDAAGDSLMLQTFTVN